nr:YopX family protein [Cryobacterium sp. TMT1-21]
MRLVVSRVIKFRVWDTKVNEWLFGTSGFSMDGEIVLMGEWSAAAWRAISEGEADRYVLLQYTGLKDKNASEIYEGDILRYQWQSNWGDRERIDRRFSVVFENGQFLQLEQDEETPDHWYQWDSLEVIGNIYENPELLKAGA